MFLQCIFNLSGTASSLDNGCVVFTVGVGVNSISFLLSRLCLLILNVLVGFKILNVHLARVFHDIDIIFLLGLRLEVVFTNEGFGVSILLCSTLSHLNKWILHKMSFKVVFILFHSFVDGFDFLVFMIFNLLLSIHSVKLLFFDLLSELGNDWNIISNWDVISI